jgi:uncharacterized protein with HEPN domain
MENEVKKRLTDILFAIERIDIHLKTCKSFKKYSENITSKAAVERELSIIGEAVVNIKRVRPDIALSGTQKIISFRNLIVHAYDSVSDDIVWIIIVKNILQFSIEECSLQLLSTQYHHLRSRKHEQSNF